jgi:hypothetical protein
MLYNKFLAQELAVLSEHEILRGNMLLSKLFRIALGENG